MGRYEKIKIRWSNYWKNPYATVRSGQDICRMLECMCGGNRKMFAEQISTKIQIKKSHARISSMLEQYYEALLDKKKYSENHMLVVLNPYRQAPLTALILLTTQVPYAVRVSLEDGRDYSLTTERTTRHRIPVFYLHAGRENEITLEFLDDKGEVCLKRKVYAQTKPLPKSLENMIRMEEKTKDSATPMTFVFGGDTKYPYVFDEKGEVRYYLSRKPKSYGVFLLSGGRFLFLVKDICAPSYANPHSVLCQEMDFLGRVYHEYYVPEGIHHDGCEMKPGGNLIAASSSMNEWVEDAIIEIDRDTGEIVKTLCLEEVLSEHSYFDYFDWAHVNTVSYEEEDHSVIICMRNLHSVIKVDWQTNELKWILCDTEFWKGTKYEEKVLQPEGDLSFCYQAHAADMLKEEGGEEKRLIIYDNHWSKRRPVPSFDEDENSYVKIYVLDEKNGRVRLEHQYATEKSIIRSNGILSGDRVFAMSGCLEKKIDGYGGMITEYTHGTEEVVNRYLVRQTFYRAYPFSVPFESFCLSMPVSTRYLIGTEDRDWEICEEAPLVQSSPIKNFSSKIQFYEDMLMIYGKDHQIGKVWVRGTKQTYAMDYHGTVQKAPSKFASFQYYLALPIRPLAADQYEIYLEADGGVVYRTEKRFVKKVSNA